MHPYDEFVNLCKESGGFNFLYYCNESASVWYNHNKTGGSAAKSWKSARAFDMPVTWLLTCDLCGVVGVPKKIQYRSSCYGWHRRTKQDYKKEHGNLKGYFLSTYKEGEGGKNTLCMGCWNKVRVIVKAQDEAEEIDKLKNKLNRERLKWLKSQTQVN